MAVPGRSGAPVPDNAPEELAARELFAVDAYLREFEARVEEVDAAGHRVLLARTAFYPGGGGQPHENRPPYLVANWCIALQGIFPSRD